MSAPERTTNQLGSPSRPGRSSMLHSFGSSSPLSIPICSLLLASISLLSPSPKVRPFASTVSRRGTNLLARLSVQDGRARAHVHAHQCGLIGCGYIRIARQRISARHHLRLSGEAGCRRHPKRGVHAFRLRNRRRNRIWLRKRVRNRGCHSRTLGRQRSLPRRRKLGLANQALADARAPKSGRVHHAGIVIVFGRDPRELIGSGTRQLVRHIEDALRRVLKDGTLLALSRLHARHRAEPCSVGPVRWERRRRRCHVPRSPHAQC